MDGPVSSMETSMENFGNLQQQDLLFLLDFDAKRSLKGGQLNEFLMVKSIMEKFPELEEYFPNRH